MANNEIKVVIGGNADRLAAELKKAQSDLGKFSKSTDAMASSMKAAWGSIAAAIGVAGFGAILKDMALASARYETLGVAMGVVGNNAGYTRAEMDAFAASLQKNGIAMTESREVLTRMAQAHIDLSKASQLARIAQDAAVVGNMNSSEAFEKMIHGVQSGQIDVLRTIGINVNFENSYKQLASQLGKTKESLTETEKMQARVNVVIEAGAGIAGTYEAAMGTAGKQLNSTQRYIDNLGVVGGSVFNDVLIVGVQGFTGALKDANAEASALAANGTLAAWGKGLTYTFAGLADAISFPFKVLAQLSESLIATGFRVVKFFEMIENATSGKMEEAKRNWRELGEIGAQHAKSTEARWTNSHIEAARRMYEQRELNAGRDAAAAAAAEKKRIAAAGGGTGSGTAVNPVEDKKKQAAAERDLKKAENERLAEIRRQLDAQVDANEQLLSITEELETAQLSKDEKAVRGIKQEYDLLLNKSHLLTLMGKQTEEEEARISATLNGRMQQDLAALKDKTKETASEMDAAFAGWASNMSKDLNDLLWGADFTFGAIAESFAKMVTQMSIQMSIVKPMMTSFESAGGVSGLLGGLGSLLGFGSTSSAAANPAEAAAGASADVSAWFGFADGGIMTAAGPLPLRAYASGGVAYTPQLAIFGEGSRPEAYVPLPDGRTIPVTMNGGGSNVTVNLIEAPGKGGQTQQRTDGTGGRIIDVFVEQVKGSIASDISRGDGAIPAAMGRTYGLNRVPGAY